SEKASCRTRPEGRGRAAGRQQTRLRGACAIRAKQLSIGRAADHATSSADQEVTSVGDGASRRIARPITVYVSGAAVNVGYAGADDTIIENHRALREYACGTGECDCC